MSNGQNSIHDMDEIRKPETPYDGPPLEDAEDAIAALLARDKADESPADDDEEEEGQAPDEDETSDDDEPADEDENDDEDKDTDDDDEDHAEDDDDEETKDDDDDDAKVASDDTVVEVTVDGKTERVSVGDLKRLHGQEASLTRKSQEVSEARKTADAVSQRHQAGLQAMLKRAEERWKPYSEIDFLVAGRQLDDEEFAQLRREAEAAHGDLQFIQSEFNTAVEEDGKARHTALIELAREALPVLQEKIEGWSPELYNSIREFAIDAGIPADTMNSTVDPAAIQIINDARLYRAAKSKAKTITKKVVKSSKNAVRSKRAAAPKQVGYAKASKKLAESGDTDDAVNALLEKWSD